MRVTNLMMKTNMLGNINRNKQDMSTKFNQYATGQRIQRPSEDPVIAVRSLKYRANLSQLEQYCDKNIPDAEAWISITESTLNEMTDLLTEMNYYCVQGASDTYETIDRNSIVNTLNEYKEQIYQGLNADYAGRYLFSGYRTDTPVLFTEATRDKEYLIEEPLSKINITSFSYVVGGAEYDETKLASDYEKMAPTMKDGYKISLAYGDIKGIGSNFTYKDEAGVIHDVFSDFTVTEKYSTDTDAYTANTNEIIFMKDTGELVLSKEAYGKLSKAKNINIDYSKNTFEKGEIRPEFYFDCKAYEVDGAGVPIASTEVSYENPSSQDICYEINYDQKLKVNTMANETITSALSKQIDEILAAVNAVVDVDDRISEIKQKQGATNLNETQKEALDSLMEQLKTERVLKTTLLQESFGRGNTVSKSTQNGQKVASDKVEIKEVGVGIAITNLGSRDKRLSLVKERLTDQKTAFEDILKENESIDLEEAILNYKAAEVTYNASLSASAKVVKNTLLDFI